MSEDSRIEEVPQPDDGKVRKPIQEEDNEQDEWYKAAREMTADNLPEFVRHLCDDYDHDYGTICHAITAAAVGAAWAVERCPSGGITGFQAGAIGWQFISKWGSPSWDSDIGAKFLDLGLLLYPQYEERFTTISKNVWTNIQKKASRMLAETPGMRSEARIHLESIVSGTIPFGLRLAEEE